MVTDRLSDFVTALRNASMASKPEFEVFNTKLISEVAQALERSSYIDSAKVNGKKLNIKLKPNIKKDAVISGLKRISKPGARRYAGAFDIKPVWGGLGITLISTPKGILTNKEARKLKVGGEILLQIW